MMKKVVNGILLAFLMLIFLAAAGTAGATQTADTTILPSGLACGQCHNGSMPAAGTEWTSWSSSKHANTQADPAGELSSEDIGLTPAQKIPGTVAGSDPEDCISCHSPTAVLANNGMTETSALSYFFTTAASSGTNGTDSWISGEFYPGTTTQNESDWPDVACTACHDASKGHPSTNPGNLNLALFNSRKFSDALSGGASITDAISAAETSVAFSGDTNNYDTSLLCGQCHGSLQAQNEGDNAIPYYEWAKKLVAGTTSSTEWSGTDHLTYDAWKLSKHGNTQLDPAGELAEEDIGNTPAFQIANENCIACHAPTAVQANGGMTEAEALGYFFTTATSSGTNGTDSWTSGEFYPGTVAKNTAEWPNVGCIVCHDPHHPNDAKNLSFFNSTTGKRQSVASSQKLCGQCHGNLRFADTDHLSYNILQGTGVKNIEGEEFDGGVGVQNQKTMPGATCVDCHMNGSSDADNNQRMTHGHTWQVIVNGGDPNDTATWGWDLGAFAGDTSNPNGDAPHIASCSKCHTFTVDAARAVIAQWKSDFATLQAETANNVNAAAAAMKGVQNVPLQAKLAEAQGNLAYASDDESGGFHNHNYLMALLNDANDKALEVINANPQSSGGGTASSSGGGGCAINPNAGFNPTLPLLIILSLLYFYYRSKKQNS